jgi:hypothetical protein
MSSVSEQLHQIAERIATLEAERDRLIRDLVAVEIQRDITHMRSSRP